MMTALSLAKNDSKSYSESTACITRKFVKCSCGSDASGKSKHVHIFNIGIAAYYSKCSLDGYVKKTSSTYFNTYLFLQNML